MNTEIKYGEGVIAQVPEGKSFMLTCKGKVMSENVTVSVPEKEKSLEIEGVLRRYRVAAGEKVSAGDFVQFLTKWNGGDFCAETTAYITACALDGGTVAIVYRNESRSKMELAFFTISDGEFKLICKSNVSCNVGTRLYIIALSENRCLVASSGGSTRSGSVYVFMAGFDGDTMRLGTVQSIVSDSYLEPSYPTLTLLPNGQVFMTHDHSTDYDAPYHCGYAMLLDVDLEGMSVRTASSRATVGNYWTKHHSFALLPSGRRGFFACVRRYTYGSTDVCQVYCSLLDVDLENGSILRLSGNTVFSGTNTYDLAHAHVFALSDDKGIVLFDKSSTGALKGVAMIFTVAGSTMTFAPSCYFNNGGGAGSLVAFQLSDTQILVIYHDYGDGNKGVAQILTVNGTSVTEGKKYVFETNPIYSSSRFGAMMVSDDSVFVAYRLTAGNSRYKGLTISADGVITVQDEPEDGVFVKKSKTRYHDFGIAKTSGSDGEEIEVFTAT